MKSVIRVLTVALLALAATLARPSMASAQQTLDICSNQQVPPGYLVVATQNRPSCPGYMSTGYNSFTIRRPVEGGQETIDICYTQTIPRGYVVVATQNRPSCPSYMSTGYNSLSIRLPGETVSICSTLSVLGSEYVATETVSRPSCPGYTGSGSNSTTYRRLASAAPPAPSATFTQLGRYDRDVYLRLREMEAWLGVGAPSHQPWTGSAAGGTVVRAALPVDAGGRYTLTAVCDEDCGDIDLRVLDGGYVVAQDTLDDRDAYVELSPARAGTLTVEALVQTCAQNPCYFGVGVYESGTPTRLPRRPRPRPRN